MQLGAQVAGLRQVVEQKSLYGRIKIEPGIQKVLENNLHALEEQQEALKKTYLYKEIAAQSLQDQLEDYEFDELLSDTKALIQKSSPPTSVLETANNLFWDLFLADSPKAGILSLMT